MKHATRLSIVLILPLLALLPLTATAESTPEAQKWIDGIVSIGDRGPFRVNYTVDMNVQQLGQEMAMKMKGKMLQASPVKFVSEFELQMGSAEAPDAMRMSVNSVGDGKTLWLDVKSPLMGGHQVMKLPFDKVEELSQFNPMVGRVANMNPMSQLDEITRLFDFRVLDRNDSIVTLSAEMTQEALQELGAALPDADPSAIREFVMELDASTGFPVALRVGGEPPLMTVQFQGLEFLESVDDAEFAFTPAGDVPVMDLGAVLGMAGGGK